MHGRPAVDLRDLGFRENEYRDERQPGTDQDALDDIQEDGSFQHEDGFHTQARIIFLVGSYGFKALS